MIPTDVTVRVAVNAAAFDEAIRSVQRAMREFEDRVQLAAATTNAFARLLVRVGVVRKSTRSGQRRRRKHPVIRRRTR